MDFMNLVQILETTGGNNVDACYNLGPIINLIKTLFDVIKIVVPIILIIYGAIDLTRAVMASDDKEIKAATSKLIKRAVAAVAVFFIVTLVTVLLSLVSKATTTNGEQSPNLLSCWDSAGATSTSTEK